MLIQDFLSTQEAIQRLFFSSDYNLLRVLLPCRGGGACVP